MAGLLPGRRTRRERRASPLRGYKLGYPMVSADGARVGFTGVALGRSQVYSVTAEAVCVQNARHHCPAGWCDCGFYCFHTLDDARALACDPEYQQSVLLEVAASGRYIRYEKGLRYARQVVRAVRVGRCGCGRPAEAFVDANSGLVGWRRLLPVCAACAGSRPALGLHTFTQRAGEVPVSCDEQVAAFTTRFARGNDEADEADEATLIPLLTAEVALLQARLDELQSQLDRLTRDS